MSKVMILEWIDANHKPFDDLALAHWNNPELAYKEYEAVRLQMDFLRERGFVVTQKEGMPTAFMAEWGAVGLSESDRVLASNPLPCFDSGTFIMGSSDVGDVANIMPTSMLWGCAWPVGVAAHTWQAVASTGSSIGLKGSVQAAKAMAGTVYDLASEPALIDEAKKEFMVRRGGKAYCPVEDLLA